MTDQHSNLHKSSHVTLKKVPDLDVIVQLPGYLIRRQVVF